MTSFPVAALREVVEMAARPVVLSLLVGALFGCGSSPPPKTLDAKEHQKQMERLNEEVLRQEGKPVPQKKAPRS